MKSPFPGMDPYLEDHWGSGRHAMITYVRTDNASLMIDRQRIA
jgi:hypothetical protein